MVKNKNEQDGEGMLYVTLRRIWICTDFVCYICQLNLTSKFYLDKCFAISDFVPLLPFMQNAS
jgi:hypothetical protein